MAAHWKWDLLENVVPFWEKYSLDREHGGFFTCLDAEGAVLDTTKYIWLQGRAVYMWARLHNELGGEAMPGAADRWFANARLGMRFLSSSQAKDPDGRLNFAVSRDGSEALHFQRKPYAAVFHVQACLEYAAALQRRSAEGTDTGGEEAGPYLVEAAAIVETHHFDFVRIFPNNGKNKYGEEAGLCTKGIS